MVEVAAALIEDGDRFMICRRPLSKARGGLWEFAGGKLENGETGEHALIRECREELAVTVQPTGVFSEVVHEYPDIKIHLTLYRARITGGEPVLLEHSELKWILPCEIELYDFCPADRELLRQIREQSAVKTVRAALFSFAEKEYGDFTSRLLPNIPRENIIGVRTPTVKKYANSIASFPEAAGFLRALPHIYLEENILHAALINKIKDFDAAVLALEQFLPHVDNWSVCDTLRPAAFTPRPKPLIGLLYSLLRSPHEYTVRFAAEMLMTYYLGSDFKPEYAAAVAAVDRSEYYIRMMQAWYLATALYAHWDDTLPLIENHLTGDWVRAKAIQKATESRRITDSQKAYLRSIKER